MPFTNTNTAVEIIFASAHCRANSTCASLMRQDLPAGAAGPLNEDIKHVKWTFVSPLAVPRQWGKVMVETSVQQAKIAIHLEILLMLGRANELWFTLLDDLIVLDNIGIV